MSICFIDLHVHTKAVGVCICCSSTTRVHTAIDRVTFMILVRLLFREELLRSSLTYFVNKFLELALGVN